MPLHACEKAFLQCRHWAQALEDEWHTHGVPDQVPLPSAPDPVPSGRRSPVRAPSLLSLGRRGPFRGNVLGTLEREGKKRRMIKNLLSPRKRGDAGELLLFERGVRSHKSRVVRLRLQHPPVQGDAPNQERSEATNHGRLFAFVGILLCFRAQCQENGLAVSHLSASVEDKRHLPRLDTGHIGPCF